MTTLNLQVNASAGDARELAGAVDIAVLNSVTDDFGEWFGFRFTGVTIAGGSTINTAVLSVYVYNSGFDEPLHTFYAEDSDNAAAFTNTANDISGRARTSASVVWSNTNLGATGFSPFFFSPPDVSALVQEVVDRGGWASGNALVIVCEGADVNRDLGLSSYDVSSANAATLDIDYTAGGASGQPTDKRFGGVPFMRGDGSGSQFGQARW